MRRIRAYPSRGIGGQPTFDRHFPRQEKREPPRCHLETLSALTITSQRRQSRPIRDSHTRKIPTEPFRAWPLRHSLKHAEPMPKRKILSEETCE